MGNGESTNRQIIDETQWEYVKQLQDHRYGDARIMRNIFNPNDQIAIISKIYNNESSYNRKIAELEEIRKFDQKNNLVRMLNYVPTHKEEFCSSFWKIQVAYEYLTHHLKKEIYHRIETNQHFSEEELWYILETVLGLIHQFKLKNICHGDIRPNNLLIDWQGRIRLLDPQFFHQGLNAYAQLLVGMKETCYASPMLLNNLKHREQKPVHQQFKSDIYSLGMTVLEAATLSHVLDCYNFDTFEINRRIVDERLNQVKGKYSERLASFLYKLLIDQELERPDVEQLLNELQSYKERGLLVAANLGQNQELRPQPSPARERTEKSKKTGRKNPVPEAQFINWEDDFHYYTLEDYREPFELTQDTRKSRLDDFKHTLVSRGINDTDVLRKADQVLGASTASRWLGGNTSNATGQTGQSQARTSGLLGLGLLGVKNQPDNTAIRSDILDKVDRSIQDSYNTGSYESNQQPTTDYGGERQERSKQSGRGGTSPRKSIGSPNVLKQADELLKTNKDSSPTTRKSKVSWDAPSGNKSYQQRVDDLLYGGKKR